jgi:hypothetical protein
MDMGVFSLHCSKTFPARTENIFYQSITARPEDFVKIERRLDGRSVPV